MLVQVIVIVNIESANHMAAAKCMQARRQVQDDPLEFDPTIRLGKKCNVISETADLLRFSAQS